MNKNKDYIALLDVAKLNLAEKLNQKIREYKEEHTPINKSELAVLLHDRQQLFLFNIAVIDKYL